MRYSARSMNPSPPAELQDAIPRSISREDMAKLPIRRYEGRICLVATPGDLEEARADLKEETIVGFDTEKRNVAEVKACQMEQTWPNRDGQKCVPQFLIFEADSQAAVQARPGRGRHRVRRAAR